jgi:hypothetical protein
LIYFVEGNYDIWKCWGFESFWNIKKSDVYANIVISEYVNIVWSGVHHTLFGRPCSWEIECFYVIAISTPRKWFGSRLVLQLQHWSTCVWNGNCEKRCGRNYCNKFVSLKSIIFWDVTPCSLLNCNRCFGGIYRLHLQGRRNNSARTSR